MNKELILEILNSQLAWYIYYAIFGFIGSFVVTHITQWGLTLRNKLNEYKFFKATQIDDMGIKIIERLVIGLYENGEVTNLKEKGFRGKELAKALAPSILKSFSEIASDEQKKILNKEHSKIDEWILANTPAVVRWVKNRNKIAGPTEIKDRAPEKK